MKRSEIRVTMAFTARDAADVVDISNRFESDISFCQPSKEINAKSLMGMISLGLKRGDTFTIAADGSDEEDALRAVRACFQKEEK